MCVMLTRISIAWRYKRSYDVVGSCNVVKIDCLTVDSNIQRTDVEKKVKRERFKDRRYKYAYDHLLRLGFSKYTDVRTYFYYSRTEKLIFLVLTFKYDLKYKALSEAKSLVNGLWVTNRRGLFLTQKKNERGLCGWWRRTVQGWRNNWIDTRNQI